MHSSKLAPISHWGIPLLLSAALSACGGNNTGGSNSSVPSTSSSPSPTSSSAPTPSSSSTAVSSSSSSTASSISSAAPSDLSLVFAANAGGTATTYGGVDYVADRFASGGSPNTTTDPIGGTSEDTLFQSERYGSYSYEIPVSDGTYSLDLHFVEMYHEASGERSFNVSVEGQSALSNFDLFSEVGHDQAFTYRVDDVAVSDGSLSIELETLVDNGTLSGFAIWSADGEYIEPPPPPTPDRSAENPGADCQIGNVPTSANNAQLPDPFTGIDGSRLTNQDEWRCRRQEILRMAEETAYGVKPPKPESVTGSISGGRITVNVQNSGRSTSFNASYTTPGGSGPFPSVIVYGGFGAPTSVFSDEGVAVISFDPYDVGEEGTGRANKRGAFYDIYGSNSSTGILMAWAWGVSRIIDVMEQEWEGGSRILIPESVAVTGCSRFGKGAFAAGVFDARVALTAPIESGTGGVPIWRGVPGEGAQSLISAYGEQPWYGDAFGSFTSNPNSFPLDTHSLVAMVAPRGLLIMDNPHIANLGPRSAHVAALAGAEVYKALGADDAITYHSNVADGSHCANRGEWTAPLRANIRKFLKGESASTGEINARSNASGNLNDWRDWTTPNLQ